MRAKSCVTLGRSLTFSGALSFHLDSKCWRCFPRQQGNSCPSSLGDLIRPSTPEGRIQGEGVLAAQGRAIAYPTPSACLKSSILRHLRLPGEPLTWRLFQLSLTEWTGRKMEDACHIGALYPCRLQRPWSPLSTGTRSPLLAVWSGSGVRGGPGAACDPGQVTHLLWASFFLSGV